MSGQCSGCVCVCDLCLGTQATVTYSAMLDRMIQLSKLLEPPFGNVTVCSPHSVGQNRTLNPSACVDVWTARREL